MVCLSQESGVFGDGRRVTFTHVGRAISRARSFVIWGSATARVTLRSWFCNAPWLWGQVCRSMVGLSSCFRVARKDPISPQEL